MSNLLSKDIIDKFEKKKVGYFRFKKLDEETMLITNDVGAYSYLSNEEFRDFIKGGNNLSEDKKNELNLKKFFKDTVFYESDLKYEYGIKNNFLAYGPILHIMIVTLRCNHKCQYCHAAAAPMNAKDFDMTEEVAKKVIDTMFYTTSPEITIEFQGGEPLVNWDIIKYTVKYATEKSIKLKKKVNFCLVTNLSLMTDEKLDFLFENDVDISTSLDGTEEIHNYNRTFKDGNSYEDVTKWIKKINDKYKIICNDLNLGFEKKIGALLTVTKKTLGNYKGVIDSYLENGLDGMFIRPLNPYGFAAADVEKLGYSEEEFIEYYKKSLDYIIEINKEGTIFREHFSSIYLGKIMKPRDPNYLDDRSPCGASIGQVAYNYDGKIYSCDEGRMLGRMGIDDFQIGEVSDNAGKTYQDMITSEPTSVLVQSSTLDGMPGYNDSAYKTYIGVCPIHNYKLRGSVYPNFSLDTKRKIQYGVIDYLFLKMKDPEIKAIFKQWIREPDRAVGKCDI
ncbi:MAG: His-Xaa-Ser system radical SAM maturase HxsB [Candidatus Gracilibacteria bacterium]